MHIHTLKLGVLLGTSQIDFMPALRGDLYDDAKVPTTHKFSNSQANH